MTGIQLLEYVQRRLAEKGLAVEADREAELYDLITEGRDRLLQAFAEVAPLVVATYQTLAIDPHDSTKWRFPGTAPDPYRVLFVRELNGEILTPAAELNQDGGQYSWDDLRTVRTAVGYTPCTGGLEVRVVFAQPAIEDTTKEPAVGLPTTCHRALAKWAVVLALTADEESDAGNAMQLFRDEMQRLEELYGSYDAQAGRALGVAFLASYGHTYGDMLY